MKLYEDKEKTHPLQSIYFGKVKAGEEKIIEVWLYNDSEAMLANIEYKFPNLPKTETLEFVRKPPINIQPKDTVVITLRWKPSLNFKSALDLEMEITAEEVYMASRQVVVTKEKS